MWVDMDMILYDIKGALTSGMLCIVYGDAVLHSQQAVGLGVSLISHVNLIHFKSLLWKCVVDDPHCICKLVSAVMSTILNTEDSIVSITVQVFKLIIFVKNNDTV